MATYEIVNLLLRDSVKVLELVHSRELGDVEAVGEDSICERGRAKVSQGSKGEDRRARLTRLALEQVLALVCGNVGYGGEDISAVRRTPLDAVAVVDSTLARLVVDVEVGQVVVEVNRSSAEVATEESGVGGEDGGNVNVTLAAEGDSETGLPLVKVGDDGLAALARRELYRGWLAEVMTINAVILITSPRNQATR